MPEFCTIITRKLFFPNLGRTCSLFPSFLYAYGTIIFRGRSQKFVLGYKSFFFFGGGV